MSQRVLLLLPTTSYKARDFLAAADLLGVDVTVGTDRRQALDSVAPGQNLVLDFPQPENSLQRILEAHRLTPFRAVLGVDDETTVLAAMAGAALGLPHNPETAARAARDKYETRRLMAAAGMRVPTFHRVSLESAPAEVARKISFPCVLKPLGLSASRGVLRADNRDEFVRAFQTIAAILRRSDVRRKGSDTAHLLVEDYLPGEEIAVEALLERGRLRVLAWFDKPDPLEGPTFEETIYVTPSRLPEEARSNIVKVVTDGCEALGLREGPVHSELRLREAEPWLLEIAARTIGGLCSRVLRFGAGITLEELVLRHALGHGAPPARERLAAGVMMIPVPGAGVLREIRGLDDARTVTLIEEVTVTVHRGARLVPLPEGDRYLGFIFARGDTAHEVEQALRAAHGCLHFDIDAN